MPQFCVIGGAGKAEENHGGARSRSTIRDMRHHLVAILVLVPLLLAAGLHGADAAALDWHVADGKDVPGAVKQSLIGESEKRAGDSEITGFTYYQTGLETKDTRFKAEFRAGGKAWVVVCKPDGTLESSESTGDAPAADAPRPNPTPGPKAPSR
jgi:hypothetical protein